MRNCSELLRIARNCAELQGSQYCAQVKSTCIENSINNALNKQGSPHRMRLQRLLLGIYIHDFYATIITSFKSLDIQFKDDIHGGIFNL